jgi:hypothetical protein
MKNSLLVFGTKNFNNSLDEIKEHLDFTLIFSDNATLFNVVTSVNALLIDIEVSNDTKNLNLINSVSNKPILLTEKKGFFTKCNYTNKIAFPLMLSDFNSTIITLITSNKFNQNSFIKIKEYTIDKNEKKLIKNNLSVPITEREIQLIELLFSENKPLSKKKLLKIIWKYSEDADTHTVETHIYRLRKKIFNKFNDENFILNFKDGYLI